MPTIYIEVIGIKCNVAYTYLPPENGDKECVTIDGIDLACADICIDPNELHKSQLDALEKEALKHYKERGV